MVQRKQVDFLSREEGLELLKQHRIIAWRESDQGWAGMLCSNGIAYVWSEMDPVELALPYDKRREIRTNTLPGWQCLNCGLGHRVMMREEYYAPFISICNENEELQTGADKWTNAFDILATLLNPNENRM